MTTTAHEIRKRRESFLKWLRERGASVLEPTSAWELVRFAGDDGVSIIYCNKRDVVTFTGVSEKAWNCYLSGGGKFKATRPGITRKRPDIMIRTLRKRDGDLCFFCQRPVTDDDASQEHLVAISHGGPNHISNLVLAHADCNMRAGSLDATAKIRMHVEARLALLHPESEAPMPACFRYRRKRPPAAKSTFPSLELACG